MYKPCLIVNGLNNFCNFRAVLKFLKLKTREKVELSCRNSSQQAYTCYFSLFLVMEQKVACVGGIFTQAKQKATGVCSAPLKQKIFGALYP